MSEYKRDCLCNMCGGTGEVVEEPGGDGYAPYYDECPMCKGEGYLELDSRDVYSDEVHYEGGLLI